MTGAQVPPSFVNKPPRGWLHSDHLFAKVIIIIIIIIIPINLYNYYIFI